MKNSVCEIKMAIFDRKKVALVRQNDGKAFRKMLLLDKRPLHILCGKSEIRKYARIYTQFITREHDFVFELDDYEISLLVEENIIKNMHNDVLYVVEVIRFSEELHNMLDDLARMYNVSIVVRIG